MKHHLYKQFGCGTDETSQAARQGLAVLMASAVRSNAKTRNFNHLPKDRLI